MSVSDPVQREEETFAALNAYLDGLHAGQWSGRDELLRARPDLKAAVACLDALEQFASSAIVFEAGGPEAGTIVSAAAAAQTEMAWSLPRDFGDYELLEEIGRGGMGIVYKARQKNLRRTVALKMIHGCALPSIDQLRRFAAEAQAAADLRHPNIVRVLDSGQVEGIPYLAMDYIEGASLAQVLTAGPLDRETAIRYLSAIARAVDYLHRQGIIHRDLKPSNILLDGDGRPIVTDFGLAKLLRDDSQLTQSGVAAGTPSYMAPEQAAGHTSRVTPLCDVYSLGAVFYEFLTGRPPFQAATAIDLLIQVLEREPPAPRQIDRSISRTLSLVCLKCLEKDPANRYPSAAALADDLERYLKGDVVEVSAGHIGSRLARWARREPALVSRLAVFLLFYAVEAVNYYLLDRWNGRFHYSVTAVLAIWVGLSFAFQRLMRRDAWQMVIPAAWAFVDAAGLLCMLLLGDGRMSPLMIGYPLLIVASGLWFRVRLVWLMTLLAFTSYSVLAVDFYVWRTGELEQMALLDSDDHVYFLVGLVAMGAAVAYQVQRVRALSRFYERREWK
ncbi:MAG TPA: serine/threonine-protein kinase [Pirellulales bacterium]|nr:serine/threonine-protein kinase [Pirellulales bacterium]